MRTTAGGIALNTKSGRSLRKGERRREWPREAARHRQMGCTRMPKHCRGLFALLRWVPEGLHKPAGKVAWFRERKCDWRRRRDRLQTVPRSFSRGFDGVPRGCASQSEKQRRGANQSETGGEGATGYKRPLARFRSALMASRGPARARAKSSVEVRTKAKLAEEVRPVPRGPSHVFARL